MLAWLLAATAGAGHAGPAADIAPKGAATAVDLKAPHALRGGIVVGFGLGTGLGGASGYPGDASEAGDPNDYRASGWMGGTTEAAFILDALSDYLSVGPWFAHTLYRNAAWRSNGVGFGLRIEGFPLARWAPALAGWGVLGLAGIGTGSLASRAAVASPQAAGTQSFLGAGTFYEWVFARALGGHLSAGPSLEYDAIWSRSVEQHGLVAGARVAFYGAS